MSARYAWLRIMGLLLRGLRSVVRKRDIEKIGMKMKKLGIVLAVICTLLFLTNLLAITAMFGRFTEGGNHQGISLSGTVFWALAKILPSVFLLWGSWTFYKSGTWMPAFIQDKILQTIYWIALALCVVLSIPSLFMMAISILWIFSSFGA